jgi:hypothetical protein
MDTPTKISKDFRTKIMNLHKVKSENSIKQINKLHQALSSLEERCDEQIANRYLVGFLEEKGVRSYEEYINSLS